MNFTFKELRDLFFSWLIISIAFAILLTENFSFYLFFISFVMASFSVGISFLAHEIMHKYYAQKYKLKAHYVAFYNMLFLALAFSFFGFIIAAPGAVVIQGRINKVQNGKISLAGPATNIILALLSILALFIFQSTFLRIFFGYSLTINALLALFNLIPVNPFDGKKVFDWNKAVYFVSLIISAVLLITAYMI